MVLSKCILLEHDVQVHNYRYLYLYVQLLVVVVEDGDETVLDLMTIAAVTCAHCSGTVHVDQ